MVNNINKLYSVQFISHVTGSHEVIGVFRDEYTAMMLRDSKNKDLREYNGDDQHGYYIVHPLYTDF